MEDIGDVEATNSLGADLAGMVDSLRDLGIFWLPAPHLWGAESGCTFQSLTRCTDCDESNECRAR